MASRHIKTLILSLFAVFALSAAIASAAQAGEFGKCEKVAKTSAYENAGCTKESATHTGNYEWAPVVAPASISYMSETKEAKLKSVLGEIICKASTDEGTVTGPTMATDTVTFTNCTLAGEPCQNVGGAAETIKTYLLDTSLIDHGTQGLSGLEPKEEEVWTQFVSSEPEHEPYQAEFECSGILFRVSGSLSGVDSKVNKMAETFKLEFGEKVGEQDLLLEYSLDGGVTWNGPIASEEIIPKKGTFQFKEKIEIRACNEPGAVSEGKEMPDCT